MKCIATLLTILCLVPEIFLNQSAQLVHEPRTDTVEYAAGQEDNGDNPSSENIGTAKDTNTSDEPGTSEDSKENQNTKEEASGSASLKLETPSAILMEATTGSIIYEKDAHKKMRPASITKIMTLILIFEAIDKGQISLTDTVSVSEHAAGMGGSQVYLEPGEEQTVEDLIKCISIASANDACVAMAEFVGGSEEAFVGMMNEKANGLGMNDTNFVNSCGLEAEGHMTSAGDIALMARELSVKHPEIFDYCTIWMDTITHHTAKGEKEFGLTNTNKLIRYYSYATGLKTGYTSQSKYCLAATATKDDVNLIAVVMAEKSPTVRNKEAVSLLDYGFANCRIYRDANEELLPNLPVENGTLDSVPVDYKDGFSYVLLDGSGTDTIEKKLELPESVTAPIQAGQQIGTAVYTQNGKEIGQTPIMAAADVPALTFKDSFLKNVMNFFL